MYPMMFGIVALTLAGLSLDGTARAGDLVHDLAQAQPGTYVLDAAHGKITWSISHLGFSTYVGQFTDVQATLALDPQDPPASRLEANVNTDSVASLNKDLDRHLRTADFLDVARYPTAAFQATRIHMTTASAAEISGNLTLHGVTKPIVIAATFNQAGINSVDSRYSVGFDGHARIKRSDFGIAYGIPVLGDEVTLHFEAEFKLQPKAAPGPD